MSSKVTIPRANLQRLRLQRRLVLHHLSLFAASAAAVLLLFVTRPYKDVWMKMSFSTAYPALFLILLTLSIGPFHVVTHRRNPVSSDLRRDIGIWAGILSIVHTIVGQNVHLRGRPWLYYVYEHRDRHLLPFRHDLFGFANYTGLIGTLIVILLLATSNDYSLRRLGTPQWKRLQRWNYAVFALIAAHAIGYLAIESQKLPFVLIIALGLAATLAIQAAGYHHRRTDVAR
jgi:methionine sulfoxide reductase heme-binding subunit